MAQIEEVAFPQLSPVELALVKPLATPCDYVDGETIFRAGQADIDLYVVESGRDRHSQSGRRRLHDRHSRAGPVFRRHRRPDRSSGDRDRVARGQQPGLAHARQPSQSDLLNRVPSLGEKLIVAFTRRRELLSQMGVLGIRVVGPGRCRDTNTVREFLYKNFVPFTWFDPETEEGQRVFVELGSPRKTPVIECGDGRVLVNPVLARAGLARPDVWKHCPSQDVDFAIVGAGPAGIGRGSLCLVGRALDVDARPAGPGRSGRWLRRASKTSSAFRRD